ncbi:MAG: hypothetical protein QXE84_09580 [Candidatus Nitrosotenuis sp.]|uniref:Uncharacterized protein n=1 Tax=Candidatus Nitrosotenuis uzonensis TaxID=1407055 RepID=A0A812F4H9_9ARCH|nr:hypothetical protein [Candidatus Nitrosotenuis uzonensis]CAE6494500.1 conserved exported hypothetical protein [Candidatus Nitrosotenuis uzonensis]
MVTIKKTYMLAAIVMAAVFAVAISPIATAFAQESTDDMSLENHADKTYEGKEGKSCPGKNKGGMNT